MSTCCSTEQDYPRDERAQREVTRLCANTGLLIMQHGAESALVESLVRRLGTALGVENVQVAIMANALTVTTLSARHCITTVRRNEDRGVNMQMVTEVQRAVLKVEAAEMGMEQYRALIEGLKPLRYPRWLTSLAIGLSCACFARLAGAEWLSCGVALVAAGIAMYVRLHLAALHFSPLISFFSAAFTATSVSGLGAIYQIGGSPKVAMAASVLLLVPGFPLINSVSDMVKGYVNTGISRGMVALLLALSSCGGILLAMTVWRVWAWL